MHYSLVWFTVFPGDASWVLYQSLAIKMIFTHGH